MNLFIKFCPDEATVLLAANVLAQIAVIAALGWWLSWGLARHRPAVRYGIWASAFLCVLISPVVSYVAARAGLSLVSLRVLPRLASADLDVRPATTPEVAGVAQPPAAADHQGAERDEGAGPDVRAIRYGVAAPYPMPAGGREIPPTRSPGDQRRALVGLVTVLWAAGAVFLLARLLHGWRSVVGLRRRLRPATGDRFEVILAEVRRILNVRALPRLAILPRGTACAGPITIGLFRPVVILPEDLIETLGSRGLRDVLVHESAHALRRDPLVGFLQRLLASAFWPYPPVHLVNRWLAGAREEVCDNYVLRQGDAPGYAETLLTISEMFRCARTQPAALGICHPHGRLEERVAGLLNPRRNVMTGVHRTTLAALAALFLTAVVVVAGTRLLGAEPPAATAATADSTFAVKRRAVNKLVKDFPEKLDLSTPESALAAICRASARNDVHALNDLRLVPWEKDLVEEVQKAMKHDPHAPKNLDQTMLGVEVVEVLTGRDDFAFVICKGKTPEGQLAYEGAPFARINGKWKGSPPDDAPPDDDKSGFPTIQAARDYFDKHKDNLWKSLMAARGKKIGFPAKADQSGKTAAPGKAGPGTSGPRPWTLANGTTMWESSSGPAIKEELKQLIAEKKYKFLSTFDSPNGEKQYVYSFVFSDGSRTGMNFSMPLEDVSSWDDYQQKQDQQRQQRHDKVNQAIAAGRFRLLNLEAMQVHLCRDAQSDKKFKVQRIQHPDGSEIAFPRADYGSLPPSVKQTSWQEHLQAIRDGRRTLLELETVNSYTYEMTADDGTKLTFQYGGGNPLKMPEK